MKNTKQPLITFCIPSYNSGPFLHFAVESLIPFGDDIEVLIVNDGSKDNTGEVADEFAAKYPFIKAIHQENGGHGEGINHGIELATGVYFKVLDSDDWVEHDSMKALLDDIKATNCIADLYICDYTYFQGGREEANRDKRIHFDYLFKGKDKTVAKGGTFKEMREFGYTKNLTLHSSMYRTEILRQSGVHCPAHVSYEDNYFIYASLYLVKQVRYVPVSLYCYLIGREGQSMQNETLFRKYKDFILDGQLVFDAVDVYSIEDKKTRKAVIHHLIMNMVLVILYPKIRGDKESKEAVKAFWKHCKETNPRQYRLVRRHYTVSYLSIPNWLGGRLLAKLAYWLGHKFVKFN